MGRGKDQKEKEKEKRSAGGDRRQNLVGVHEIRTAACTYKLGTEAGVPKKV